MLCLAARMASELWEDVTKVAYLHGAWQQSPQEEHVFRTAGAHTP